MRSTIFLVAIFMLSSIPVQAEDSGRAIICGESDISQLPSQINVLDQECHQISLGPLLPGATVEFDLSASGLNFDFLVFKANALPVYSNEQSYRSSTIWAEETVFEEIGLGRASYNWHWTVPDGTESNWYVVLDNMAHSGDGGQGSQGGSLLIVDLDITFPSSNIWTLHDELVRMGVNDHSLLVDSSSMILDEGTQVQIRGIPLAGNPDIFLLTASQRQSYLDGTAPEFSVIGSSNLLQITSDITETYTVDSAHAGIPLYLYADNEQGPTGGGDGQSEAIFTVIVTLNPVLDGVITTGNPGATIDVGESISFSANSTPNLSGQIDASGYQWDLDLDGNYDLTRNWAETSWSAPGAYTIRLLTQGIDSQSDTTDFVIDVEDMTAPSAQFFGGSSNFPYGYDAPITLTSSSTDNHVIEREEWWVDGVLEQSDNGTGNTFTISFSQGGSHTFELRVFDETGLSDNSTITVTVTDITDPVVDSIVGPTELIAGETKSWTVSADDPESSSLSWSWDFDNSENSDEIGTSTDDNQATGALVEWTFTDSGTYYITATITNDAGRTSSRELLVVVESSPSSAAGTSDVVKYGIAFVVVIVVLAGIVLFIRYQKSNREHQQMMASEALRKAEEEAEAAREPDRDEQLNMFQSRSSGFSSRASDDEFAQIAGIDAGYSSSIPQQNQPTSITQSDANLLSAFEEPEPEPKAEPKPEPKPAIEPKVEQKSRAKVELPESVTKGTVISSGIELPSSTFTKVEEPEKVVESAPLPQMPESVDSEPEVKTEPSTSAVIGQCSSCDQQYEVDMPVDIDAAQIDCPKCGFRNIIRR